MVFINIFYFLFFRKGLNYNHGTGHGIGAYLKVNIKNSFFILNDKSYSFVKVHEGPTLINLKGKKSSGLKPGMFFSDEPGYYKVGLVLNQDTIR